MIAEGPPKWKVDTVIRDLEESVKQLRDAATRARLSAVIERIKAG